MNLVLQKDLNKRFQKILDKRYILTAVEELTPYECDGLPAHRKLPLIVVLPANTEEIQAIIKICHDTDTPVVARGAGTGLSGGAMPIENGILLSLARLNKILHIDTDNRYATLEPGVRNLAISEAVQEDNLYYAPDPSSQIACSIGGNVAENAGGVHCLKYGLTTHNILRLKMVTMEGDICTIGSLAFDSSGLDLLAVMAGSEGMLGVITEITVKLLPTPTCAKTLLASFDNVEKAGQAVANIIAEGILPAGLEMMDNPAIRAAEAFAHAGYPEDAAAILLCELDGSEQEVDDSVRVVQKSLFDSGATNVKVATDEVERNRFWAGRKAAFPAVGRISPDYYCMDGTIPRKHLASVLKEITRLSVHYKLDVANVFHAGDGNLHPLILFDANKEGELDTAEKFGSDILQLCVKVGGTITGEHGVGLEKINQMCVQFPEAELTIFHALKKAFDDKGLLNPGKAIPTLARCAEFGAMHVHNGELPFPEIERF